LPYHQSPKGGASPLSLWNPAAFEKAGGTFFCAPRSPVQALIRIKNEDILQAYGNSD